MSTLDIPMECICIYLTRTTPNLLTCLLASVEVRTYLPRPTCNGGIVGMCCFGAVEVTLASIFDSWSRNGQVNKDIHVVSVPRKVNSVPLPKNSHVN